jgi:molecular chaperone HscB
LQIDQGLVEKKYSALAGEHSRVTGDHHPDPETLARLKKAYRTFQDPDETIRYVLQLKKLMGGDEEYSPDPQFLLEVGDINEELMELEMDESQEQLMNV